MNLLYKNLENELTLGLQAWRRSRLQRGLAISLLGLLFLFGLVFLATPALSAFPTLWWILLVTGTLGWLALTVQYLVLPLRHRPNLTQIARHIEEQNPDLEDRLATAVEFGRNASAFSAKIKNETNEPPANPNALLQRLLQDAIKHTTKIDFPQQLEIRFARWWRTLAAVAAVLTIVAFFGWSGALRLRLNQFYTTVKNAPKVLLGLQVSPGDVRVRLGETVEIVAQTPDEAAIKAYIYVASGKQAALATNRELQAAWSANEMEATTTLGKFLYRFFDVRDTVKYYVRVGEEFSAIYTIIPLAAPEVKDVRLTYHFPAEVGLSSRRETGNGDVYAPAGTRVDLEILASQPLAKAEWLFEEKLIKPMQLVADTLARVTFAVEKDGYYIVRLTNADGMNNAPVEYFVHLMPDEAPQITLERPGQDTRPTMLEEVAMAAQVSDDYGLKRFELIYSINERAPKRQDLLATTHRQRDGENSRMNYRAATQLFLEELGVQPGDFISYYYEAGDAKQKTESDLYFLEVRPFDEEFYRALSQGGGGESSPGLAVSEKEIITATWKLERARQKFSNEELEKSSKALAETQVGLQESVTRMMEAAKMRGGFGDDAGKLLEYLEQAVEMMQTAVPPLQDTKLIEALDPERRAYQFLLKFDAEMRRHELAMGGNSSASFGQLQSSEEFSRLFQEEMNKIQSKYETLQNQQQQQQQAQLSEAQQKVKELAQRQERLNELNRMLQRENQSAEEKKRQIERLRRQQDELNREAQNLARQMQQLGQSSGASQQSLQQLEETLRQAADDMKRTTDNLRRDNLANAGAEGNRALDRLRRLEEQLQQQRSNSLRENMTQVRDELQRLADAQSQLSDDLERQRNASGPEQKSRWHERQQDLQRRAEQTRENLQKTQQTTAAGVGEGQKENAREKHELAQDLRKLTQEFDQRKISERMAEAGDAIQQERFDEAERMQRETAQNLKRLEAKLGESLSQLAEAPDEKLDVALQETQRLRRELEESLRERAEANASAPPGGNADSPATQPNQGRGGQQGQNPQFTPNGAPSGTAPSDQKLRPEEMNWWSEQAWQGIRDLEKINPFLRADTALADDYSRLLQNYRGAVRSFRGGDPLKREQIEKQLLDPLRRFEAELATRLAVLQNQQQILTVRDEPVPPQYREMVDKYFETLSKKR